MTERLSPSIRVIAALVLSLGLVTSSHAARADVWGWITDLVSAPDHTPEEVSLESMTLPPDAIVTGPGEVRTIELGRDILELYPRTAVTVKTAAGNATIVHIITGTVRAKVAKRKSHTFRMETPVLVGTVKGTVFEVSTTGSASAVSVYEGRVAVKAKGGVGGVDVTPGRTATVTDAEREPSLGNTPDGGAAVAAKALSRRATGSSASATDNQPNQDNKGNDRSKQPSRSDRTRPAGSGGSGGGSSGGDDGEGGEGGGDGEGGEGGDDD